VLTFLIDSSFLCVLLVLFALQLPETLIAAACLCGIYAITRPGPPLFNQQGLISVLLIMLALIVVVIIRNDQRYQPIFYMLAAGFVLYGVKRFASLPLTHIRRCLEFAFWFSVVVISVGLLMNWGELEPLGQIIPGSSTNGLPSYLIVLQVALSIAVYLERGRLPLLSVAVTFAVAMLGVGRGSIIVSMMILTVSFVGNAWLSFACGKRRELMRYFAVAFMIALSGGAYFLINHQEVTVTFTETKWAWGLTDPPRAQMISDYLLKLDDISILIGADYEGTVINELYGGNPHNSYVRLHSFFGLPGVLLVPFSLLLIFMANKTSTSQYIVGMLILLVLMRAITEPILFPTALDFFYFLNIFLFYRHAPVRCGNCSIGRSNIC
jgi:hypothetical protein